jgi:hypothetical protein
MSVPIPGPNRLRLTDLVDVARRCLPTWFAEYRTRRTGTDESTPKDRLQSPA